MAGHGRQYVPFSRGTALVTVGILTVIRFSSPLGWVRGE